MDKNLLEYSFDSFADQLKIEGVNCKGYGILPKYVILDKDLSIEAKGIYAYFCSFSGNGDCAFPTRAKILSDLQISKDAYYKHFHQLIEQGYIFVKQSYGEKSMFARNVYTLVSNPKKIQLLSLENTECGYKKIQFLGIKAWGYGMIPKAVMVDQRLPLKAKALYAYFCSFTGSGNTAFPRFEQIIAHIRINKEAYYKYFNMLQQLNYLTVVQRRQNGKLGVNDYYLNDAPDIEKAWNDLFPEKQSTVKSAVEPFLEKRDTVNVAIKPFPENQDTVKTTVKPLPDNQIKVKTVAELFPEKRDTVETVVKPSPEISDTVISDTDLPDTEKQDTNINSKNINKYKNITPSLNAIELVENIKEEMCQMGKLPYTYKLDERKMTEAIHFMTDWESLYPNGYVDELRQRSYNLFNTALIQMCVADEIKLKGNCVTYAKVIDKLNELTQFGDSYADMSEFSEVAISNFYKATIATEIKNPLKYMQSCIWDALLTGNIEMYSSLKREFGI